MLIGMVTKANKKALFVTLMDHVPRFEAHEACFSPNATDLLCLLVAQVPRPQDNMVIFVPMTMTTITTTIQPITLLLAHACEVIMPLYLIPFSLPSALTVDNVLRELKDVSWETLSDENFVSHGGIRIQYSCGVLQLPESQRHKIEAEYSTEDERRTAAVRYWLASDPYASWRRLIRQLHRFEEHAVAKQIYHYAEKLTGMTYTLQIRGIPIAR